MKVENFIMEKIPKKINNKINKFKMNQKSNH